MSLKSFGNLKYYSFEGFEKTGLVRHCFSTRFGGVSKNQFEALNFGFGRGDLDENVLRNYKILGNALGMDYNKMVSGKQVHKTKIKHVTSEDIGFGITKPTNIIGYDGLVTNIKNIVLVTYHADCVPIFFLDPEKKVIALSHAGWRGTADGIAQKTVEEMENEYGSNPSDILAGIGPSIGKCCFQVDTPVYNEFKAKHDFADEYITKDKNFTDKYMIDLWGINKELLLKGGLKDKNIFISGLCTKCRKDIFYSHRAMGENRGSMAAFLELI